MERRLLYVRVRFAANAASGAVVHVDGAGKPLASWGGEWDGSETEFGMCSDWDAFLQPCSSQALALSPEGDVVYLLDSARGRVQRFTPDGAPLADLTGLGATGEIQETAQGIAVGPDGSLYASDTPNRRGEYFGNPWLAERPLVISHTAEIDMDWGEAAPAPELPVDGWSARFERTFRLNGGEYGFMGEGEGGIRAWVGDKLVVDEWNPAPGSWRRWYGFVLPEDGEVAVRLEFKDTGGAASLSWSLAHGPPSTLTPSASPTGSVPSTPSPTVTPSEGAGPIDRVFVPFAARQSAP